MTELKVKRFDSPLARRTSPADENSSKSQTLRHGAHYRTRRGNRP